MDETLIAAGGPEAAALLWVPGRSPCSYSSFYPQWGVTQSGGSGAADLTRLRSQKVCICHVLGWGSYPEKLFGKGAR